ncbi:autotransporter outer membrane beta-barrel domain-containing protein, partial [Staphylococcus aureus]
FFNDTATTEIYTYAIVGSVSGLFQSGDDYQLSNNMKVDGQSYDSMRYELGVDAGYFFMIREPPGPTQGVSSAEADVYT